MPAMDMYFLLFNFSHLQKSPIPQKNQLLLRQQQIRRLLFPLQQP
jgi:hypothetical protein